MLSQRDDAVVYQGEGEKFARRLSKVIHGGQVVLSETAWASIQDQIPGQSQVSLIRQYRQSLVGHKCRSSLSLSHTLRCHLQQTSSADAKIALCTAEKIPRSHHNMCCQLWAVTHWCMSLPLLLGMDQPADATCSGHQR